MPDSIILIGLGCQLGSPRTLSLHGGLTSSCSGTPTVENQLHGSQAFDTKSLYLKFICTRNFPEMAK